MTTHCKRGHLRTEANTAIYAGNQVCKDCRKELRGTAINKAKKRAYMKQYRQDYKKPPIDDWRPKDVTTTPTYFPDIIFKKSGQQASWYERSRAQLKELAAHKYAVKSRG